PLVEAAADATGATEPAPVIPVVAPVPAPPPVGRDETVVIAPPSRAIGPRVAAAVAIAALALIIVAIIVHKRGSDKRVAVTTRADTAAGEVAPRPDTNALKSGLANLPAPSVAPYPSSPAPYPNPGVPMTPG